MTGASLHQPPVRWGWVAVRNSAIGATFGLTIADQPRSAIVTALVCLALHAHDRVRP